MLYIFPDTNVFYNSFYLTNSTFALVAAHVKNSESVLLISEVVVKEVENLHSREFQKAGEELKKATQRLGQLNFDTIPFSAIEMKLYEFKQILRAKMQIVEFVGYGAIPNATVVARAIAVRLPFKPGEKGYRDTMIWLSLLGFLRDKPETDEVAFITTNSRDFFAPDSVELHPDLKADLLEHEIKCKITVYNLLTDFSNSILKRGTTEYSPARIREEFLADKDPVIEEMVTLYIENISNTEMKKLLDAAVPSLRFISALFQHEFYIYEGIEDGAVTGYARLSSNTLYIHYEFNLRRCSIGLVIPSSDYFSHKSKVDVFYPGSYEMEDDQTFILYNCRSKFSIGFELNTTSGAITGFELLEFEIIKTNSMHS